jgi:hypothetical protein
MISIKYIFFLKELFRKLQHPSLEDGVGSSDAQTPQDTYLLSSLDLFLWMIAS